MPPPAPFYVRPDSVLVLAVRNSVAALAVNVQGRILGTRGELVTFAERLAPASDRSESTGRFTLPEGFLLTVAVGFENATPLRGQTFVQLGVGQGTRTAATLYAVLARGYLSALGDSGWPPGRLDYSTDGPGVLRSITGTDPAAGVDWSETVPTGARWALLAVSAELVTDVTVATRIPRLVADDGAAIVYMAQTASAVLPASTTARAAWGRGGSFGLSNAFTVVGPTVPWLALPAGGRFRVSTTGLQAGDNWGAPQLLVEEWIAT